MPRFFKMLVVLTVSNAAFAQTEHAVEPKTMLGFLKPGMHVGVRSITGTPSVILTTYTEGNYAVARDLQRDQSFGVNFGDAKKVAETNSTVRKELDAYLSRQNLTDASTERIRIMPLVGTSLGTLVAIGDDFVLFELEGESKRRRIIPKASIGSIYLDANPIRFYGRSLRSRTTDSATPAAR